MNVYTERGDNKAWRFALKWIGIGNATFISMTEEGNPAITRSPPYAPDWKDEEPAAFEAGARAERAAVVAYLDALTEDDIDSMGLNAVGLIRDAIAEGVHAGQVPESLP